MKPSVLLIITFLIGFAVSAITGGAPIVLLILMPLLAAGLLAWTYLDPRFTLPKMQLSHEWTHGENSAPHSSPAAFLGVGHQVRR